MKRIVLLALWGLFGIGNISIGILAYLEGGPYLFSPALNIGIGIGFTVSLGWFLICEIHEKKR